MKKIKKYIFRRILNMFGYEKTIELHNKYHAGRIDSMLLSDFIMANYKQSEAIAILTNNTKATCICCKNKENTTSFVQINHYI